MHSTCHLSDHSLSSFFSFYLYIFIFGIFNPGGTFFSGVAALCMLLHENTTSIAGLAIMAVIYVVQRNRLKRQESKEQLTG
jgi:hypothetical protein